MDLMLVGKRRLVSEVKQGKVVNWLAVYSPFDVGLLSTGMLDTTTKRKLKLTCVSST